MTEQHPTIPGVTISEYTEHDMPAMALGYGEFTVWAERVTPDDEVPIGFVLDDDASPEWITVENARTLGAMLIAAVDWFDQHAGETV